MDFQEADYTSWATIRTLATQGTEAAPTTSSAFVEVQPHAMPRVELRIRSGSLVGSPTSVTLAVWRKSGGAVDKIGTWEVLLADISAPIPQLFESYDPHIYVTVQSFAGNSGATITATVEARGVFGG